MKEHGPPGSEATVEFLFHMDKFFDCLNGNSLTVNKSARQPYKSVSDSRFQVFLFMQIRQQSPGSDTIDNLLCYCINSQEFSCHRVGSEAF